MATYPLRGEESELCGCLWNCDFTGLFTNRLLLPWQLIAQKTADATFQTLSSVQKGTHRVAAMRLAWGPQQQLRCEDCLMSTHRLSLLASISLIFLECALFSLLKKLKSLLVLAVGGGRD